MFQWTLEISSNPGKAAKTQPDFQGLHNLAKHTIYLRENCEAALATIDDLRDHHKAMFGERVSPAQEDTRQGLKYQKSLFQSTQRRLASLESRISNLVQLSFHIVTQGDSRVMQSENQSMKTIAVMTLIFMPLSTVAGIFGTQFMKLDEGPGHHITVSKDFWLMWLIAVPLTIIVIVMWLVWYADAKKRLIGEIPRDAERYMGWKTLRQTLRGSEEGKKGQYAVVTPEVTGKCEEA
jgi:Mg2+ and Co2+ transporter CorA